MPTAVPLWGNHQDPRGDARTPVHASRFKSGNPPTALSVQRAGSFMPGNSSTAVAPLPSAFS
ncbi:hypothetical protein [Nostoc sp. 106C]|uniref:hypothetical protein n=1 Tax=Nostoc sp. 106C TaxID=1932667 RepID=UPI00117CFE5E|nr:hypothetical protein [Nostoc sp. 106C]